MISLFRKIFKPAPKPFAALLLPTVAQLRERERQRGDFMAAVDRKAHTCGLDFERLGEEMSLERMRVWGQVERGVHSWAQGLWMMESWLHRRTGTNAGVAA